MRRMLLGLTLPALMLMTVLTTTYSASFSAGTTSTTGINPIEDAIPWDYEPFMTGSISPGFTQVTEGDPVVTTINGSDMDTYKNPSTNALFQYHGNPWIQLGAINSGNQTTTTLTSGNANTGARSWTVVRTARTIPAGESHHLYVDYLDVVDADLGVLEDYSITGMAQQVWIDKRP